MSRDPIPTWYFALVIVRRGDQFLLVQERKHGQQWYVPAGRIEPGERLVDGAVRETLEEAGIAVCVSGIYRIEHAPRLDGTRLRVVFGAEPLSDTAPKAEPDHHSLRAAWFTLDAIVALPLRSREVLALLCEVAAGGPLYPLSLLAPVGA